MYITLERGEFEKGSGKTVQRNVEVSMVVLGASGRVIEVFYRYLPEMIT